MSVKQIITVLCIGCMITPALSAKNKKSKEAEPEGYKFTTVIENPITSIKDQASSGTCWCFSALIPTLWISRRCSSYTTPIRKRARSS